ncbi:adenosylcobinamide-phosphate synthase [Photobacterium malacitanum]|uniref:Adenosylcobinamide-phosphate synthase n=1 Tax=Photobacterium malacitanum TaxID=2204294 RepID=A0A1Y6MLG9_9GAMM|nr:cobalamin biosynthesis family protein [Photobacterium malacitanum]SMY37282.1 adenosylcobinamide-phosphate synthase [Photobacterium malacitanum]
MTTSAFIASLTTNSSLLALWGALLLHWLLPIPHQLHPLRIWQRLALLIATRVNHPHESYSQRLLAGYLAWALMWLTALVLLIAINELVWYSTLFQLTLLWLALDWHHTADLSRQFNHAYNRHDKNHCRQLLAPHINRNTAVLSLLGLGKAGAETIILSYGRHVVGVLFWYAIGGGIGAILYRLAISLARAWSPTRAQYAVFGYPAIRIAAIVDIVPLRLLALLISVGHNSRAVIQGLRQQGEYWHLPGPGWLLVAIGHKLALSLGGPAIYNNIKMQRPRLGGRIAPAALHLSQIQQLITQRLYAWIIVESLLLYFFGGVL